MPKYYVAPGNGWILFSGEGYIYYGPGNTKPTKNLCSYASINGTLVYHHHYSGSAELFLDEMTMVPVKKGDTVTAYLNSGHFVWSFIPCR